MRSSLFLGAVMAMGAAAAPVADPALKYIDVLDVVTVTVPAGYKAPAATPAPKAQPQAAPAPAAAAGGSFLGTGGKTQPKGPQPTGYQDQILAVANNYRDKYHLGHLTYDSSFESNCKDVGQSGGGVKEIHKLIPGKGMAQVITPGVDGTDPNSPALGTNYSGFELAYLSWLCEVPSATLGGACDTVSNTMHMMYGGDTGHYKILTDPSVTSIGCAFVANPGAKAGGPYGGLWTCDYGM